MAKVSPRTLSGFMELLPEQQMKMEHMMEITPSELFRLWLHAA